MNCEKEINIGISEAINNKNEEKYITVLKRAITYFLDNKISLDTLDSIGARYLPYMTLSKKYSDILDIISSLEIQKNPKKIAKECLDNLNKLDKN